VTLNPAHTVIAVDGPAASGKSSVARALALRLGFVYVNSGAMYRAFTWHVLEKQSDPRDPAAVLPLLRAMDFQCGLDGSESTLRINGVDPGPRLCDPGVNAAVSSIASIPEVREYLVARQREYGRDHNLVMEGRDIGSVVFPQTPYKFYIDASPEVRARRRARQGLHDEINARDRHDSSRKNSPLRVAPDAEVIDSSELTIDGVVAEIITRLEAKGLNTAK
jgi:cytidylate kinase